MKNAHDLGFKKIYLFVIETSLVNFYTRIGFKKTRYDVYENKPVTVMEINV
jgi:hypothetical protein